MGADSNKDTASIPGASNLVEFRNGKIIFRQKPVSYEKLSETLHEIVKFREMLEKRAKSNDGPLIAIPDEHKPVIIKLAQESDKGLNSLSKRIQQELAPQNEDEGGDVSPAALPLHLIESTIKTCMTRVNYGLEADKVASALKVWRWEVDEKHRHWLPKSAQEKAESRLAERHQAKKDIVAIFDAFPQAEKDAILPQKPFVVVMHNFQGEHASKEGSTDLTASIVQPIKQPENSAMPGCLVLDDQNSPPKVKRQEDPLKAAKEKERLEKKAAKAQKEQKERAAVNKSRALMANFFVKPKAGSNTAKSAPDVKAVASSSLSDFERSFKPFVLKKDTQLAPINRFTQAEQYPGTYSSSELIIIDDVEESKPSPSQLAAMDIDVGSLLPQERLRCLLQPLSQVGRHCRKRARPPQIKSYNPVSVRDLVSKLSEAEMAGDVAGVRRLMSKLRDRRALPAKVLIFQTDARPGYYGTWTRNSRVIGPRTPLERDVVEFDYGYDSGEDWEEEAGGDADDIIDDGDEEDEVDDEDSDVDDWLVEDDEIPDVNALLQQDDPLLPLPDLPKPAKRKSAEGTEKSLNKKRKVVLPLVPFVKGPQLETTIGKCESDVFKPYRIQFFNDACFPIDPFKHISATVEEGWNCGPNSRFVVPEVMQPPPGSAIPLPPTSQHKIPAKLPTVTNIVNAVTGRKASTPATPKTSFPDAHLPYLRNKIETLNAPSLTFIVDSLHQELKAQNVRKNAIEAKVKEVAEKCKVKKVWVLKSVPTSVSQLPPIPVGNTR